MAAVLAFVLVAFIGGIMSSAESPRPRGWMLLALSVVVAVLLTSHRVA